MQFTHEVTLTLASPWRDVWNDWADVHALPRYLSHVRATAPGDCDDMARLVILLDGRHLEFAIERTMCAEQTLCWQSLGEMFLYVLTLRVETAQEGSTEIALTVAYDPPGFLPDIAESLGRSRTFKRTLEADLRRYAEAAQSRCSREYVVVDLRGSQCAWEAPASILSQICHIYQPPKFPMQPGHLCRRPSHRLFDGLFIGDEV